MTRFERGYRAALSDVTSALRMYSDVNLMMAGDNVILDPLMHGEPATSENIAKSRDCQVLSTIHAAQSHAARHAIETIANMERRTK